MAKKFLVFLITILTTVSISAQNTQTNSDLAEAARLNKETERLFAQRKYDEALKTAQQELALREKIGDELPAAAAHFNLAVIYGEIGKNDDAERHLQAALPVYRKKPGETSDRVYSIYTSLASISYIKNDKNAAAEFLKSALPVAEKVFGAQSEQFAKTNINLAALYAGLGRHEEAEKYYLQAIGVNDKLPENAKVSFAERRDIYQYECFLRDSDPQNHFKRLSAFIKSRQSPTNDVYGGVVNIKAKRLVAPPYPNAARKDRISGLVYIRVVIDENGDVVSAESYCGRGGHPLLIPASIEAARKLKFPPTLIEGKPVKVIGIVVYKFIG